MEKSSKKVPKKYYCADCDYTTCKKSQWNRHIMTAKHKNAINAIYNAIQKSSDKFTCKICNKTLKHLSSLYRHQKICKKHPSQLAKLAKKLAKISHQKFECVCGKSYKHASSLSKHKIKCISLKDEGEISDIGEIIPTNNVEHLLKNIMLNNKAILEENKILREKITNLECGNIYNNTQNNQFNINMFLNEKCKNAMNLEDFVEKIKLTLEDLQFTRDNGYALGISNILIKNLNDMDITERPIHCSDQKRMQFYVKNADEWSKDKNNEKINCSIEKVSKKQIKSIQDWILANPDYLESDSKTEEYFTLVKSITESNDYKNLRSIKRKVGENVKIN
jgi:hypothetical protein